MKFILAALATGLFLIAGTGNACELICQKTTATYTGALGGIAGADAKCQTEFGTGWKFPRSASFVANMTKNSYGANGFATGIWGFDGLNVSCGSYSCFAWTGAAASNQSGGVNNCNSWASNDPSYYAGGLMAYNNSYYMAYQNVPCDTRMPIVCCNM